MSKFDQSKTDISIMKRRDPKNMTMEELDEYINKNKIKLKQHDDNKTNNSFQSQKNYSYIEGVRSFNKTNDIIKVENEKQLSINYNPFIKDTNTSNISYEINSDNEEKYKFKTNQSLKDSNISAANNYLKALQEKIRILSIENEEVKKNFIEVSELLEKERSEFQNKLISEINKSHDNEILLKNNLRELENDNKILADNYNELKMKISLMSTNINILENEKDRHLEQNAIDKQNLEEQIDSLLKSSEEDKMRIVTLSNENNNLKNQISKYNEDISKVEKNYQKFKDESMSIKHEYNDKILEFTNEIEKLKKNFDYERNDLLQNIRSLKDIIKQLDYENKRNTKNYEKTIRELNCKMNKIELGSNNISKIYSANIKSLSKEKQSKPKTNAKLKSSSSKSGILNDSRAIPSRLDSPKSVKSNKSKKSKSKKKIKTKKEEPKFSNSQEDNLSISNNKNNEFLPIGIEMLSPIYQKKENSNFLSSEGDLIKDQLTNINNNIFELERNISDLNRNYKNLLIKLNTSISSEEAANLKRNINIIANNLQEQSEKLMNMKSKQQELLKSSYRR